MSSSKLTNIIDSFWNKCAGDQSYGHQSQCQWFSHLEAPNDPHKTVFTLMDQWYPRSRHCRTAILIHSDRHRQLKIHQTHTFFEKTLSNTWLIRRNIYYWGYKTCQMMILISDMHSNGFFAFECNPTAKKSKKNETVSQQPIIQENFTLSWFCFNLNSANSMIWSSNHYIFFVSFMDKLLSIAFN